MDKLLMRYAPGYVPLADKARLGQLPEVLGLDDIAEVWALERVSWDTDKAEIYMAGIVEALVAAIEQGDLENEHAEFDEGEVYRPRRVYRDPHDRTAKMATSDPARRAWATLQEITGTPTTHPPGFFWEADSERVPRIHRNALRALLLASDEPLPSFWFPLEERLSHQAALASKARHAGEAKAKAMARKIAHERWSEERELQEPITRTGDMASDILRALNEDPSEFGRNRGFTVATVRSWISELAPPDARKGGRPRKNSLSAN